MRLYKVLLVTIKAHFVFSLLKSLVLNKKACAISLLLIVGSGALFALLDLDSFCLLFSIYRTNKSSLDAPRFQGGLPIIKSKSILLKRELYSVFVLKKNQQHKSLPFCIKFGKVNFSMSFGS